MCPNVKDRNLDQLIQQIITQRLWKPRIKICDNAEKSTRRLLVDTIVGTKQQSASSSLDWVRECMVPHSLQSMRAGAANNLAPSQAVSHSVITPQTCTLGSEEALFASVKRLGFLKKALGVLNFLPSLGKSSAIRAACLRMLACSGMLGQRSRALLRTGACTRMGIARNKEKCQSCRRRCYRPSSAGRVAWVAPRGRLVWVGVMSLSHSRL